MGGGSNTTTTQKADPWHAAQPYLQKALALNKQGLNQGMYDPGIYGGDRVADMSPAQMQGINMGINTAMQGQPGLATAMGGMQGLAQGDPMSINNAGRLNTFAQGGGAGQGTLAGIIGNDPMAISREGMLGRYAQGNAGGQGRLNEIAGRDAMDVNNAWRLDNIASGDARGQAMLSSMASGQAGAARQGALRGMIDEDRIYRDLDAVKQSALGDAVPAAAAMFSGSGMIGSTPAMDTVGRAATEAVAPIEYGAWNEAQNRALSAQGQLAGQMAGAQGQLTGQKLAAQGQLQGQQQAARDAQTQQTLAAQGQRAGQQLAAQGQLQGQRQTAQDAAIQQAMQAQGQLTGQKLGAQAQLQDQQFQNQQLAQQGQLSAAAALPSLMQAQYMPSQMMQQFGGAMQGQDQNEINARMQEFAERSGADQQEFQSYLQNLMGLGGMGSSQTTISPGASTGQKIGGAAMSGLGTYGALMATPAASFAIPAALLAGGMGLL